MTASTEKRVANLNARETEAVAALVRVLARYVDLGPRLKTVLSVAAAVVAETKAARGELVIALDDEERESHSHPVTRP